MSQHITITLRGTDARILDETTGTVLDVIKNVYGAYGENVATVSVLPRENADSVRRILIENATDKLTRKLAVADIPSTVRVAVVA